MKVGWAAAHEDHFVTRLHPITPAASVWVRLYIILLDTVFLQALGQRVDGYIWWSGKKQWDERVVKHVAKVGKYLFFLAGTSLSSCLHLPLGSAATNPVHGEWLEIHIGKRDVVAALARYVP